MEIKQQIARMVDKLTHYHWSPEHPSTYIINIDNQERGIGVIAHKNYGAFNLAWGACKGKWETREEQHTLVVSFSKYQALTSTLINGEPVGDWACLLKPKGFSSLIANIGSLTEKVKIDLLVAADGALHVQHI